jgi:hypothetical protein
VGEGAVTGWRRDRVIAACGAKPAAVEDYPFGDGVAAFRVAGRMFAPWRWALGPAGSASSVIPASLWTCVAAIPVSPPLAPEQTVLDHRGAGWLGARR